LNKISIHTEQELFRLIAEGDEAAFAEFYLLVKTDCSAYAYRILESRESAQEVIQESLIRLWLHRDKLADVSNPRAWFHRIVANECIRYLKKHGFKKYAEPERLYPVGPTQYQTELVVSYRETAHIVGSVIASLPPKRREIYQLSREEGLTQHEIAERLGVSRDYVKQALAICLQVIRQRLVEEGFIIPVIIFWLH